MNENVINFAKELFLKLYAPLNGFMSADALSEITLRDAEIFYKIVNEHEQNPNPSDKLPEIDWSPPYPDPDDNLGNCV